MSRVLRFWGSVVLGSVALILVLAGPVSAQTVNTEADITIGRSTEGVSVGATQLRVFGASKSDWRFFAEGVFGKTRGEDSDAFSAAYPYDGRVRAMELFVEKTFHPGEVIFGMRAGRYRTPFGISGRGEHAYSGFVRAPLIRYGEDYGLSNTSLEAGVDVVVGVPALLVEASIGRPSDEGETHRLPGLDTVVRVQAYRGPFIIGVSHQRNRANRELFFATGKMDFTGIDARWMYQGVQIRGEFLTGRPFDGVTTRGWYLDGTVHRVGMGPVTAVARVERLDYEAGPFSTHPRRVTVGARIRLPHGFSGVVNITRESAAATYAGRTMLDVGVTYSIRR